jgi:prephenate dehydrogenase
MLILGGTGETGSWVARYFKDCGLDVAVWGPSGKTDLAAEMGVRYAHDMMNEARESDIVLLSVPIAKTIEVIRQVAPCMRQGSLLMDVTSLKSEPMKAMIRHAPEGVEIIGTHPMFGPTMPALKGQTMILTPAAGRSEKWLPKIRSLLEAGGARIEMLNPEEHDEIMAVVQALTHFAYIGIGATLQALDFDVEKSRKFMSPVYEIMIDFVGRILDQSPELYASIQQNPKATLVRQTFIAECMRLSEKADSGNLEGFEQIMRKAAKHYGETHQALEQSDKLINWRIKEKED